MTREEAVKFLKLMRKAVSYFEEYGHDKASMVIECDKAKAIDMAIEALSLAELKPKFESADAVQGEWIEKYNGNGWNDFWDYTCSNCGKKYERADAVLYHANYCPNCGARMTPYKGGDDE